MRLLLRLSTFAISILLLFYFYLHFEVARTHYYSAKELSYVKRQADFETNNDIACKLPILDPFDKSIKKFIEETVDPPKCLLKYPAVFKLGLNFSLIRESNTSKWKDCCYKTIQRSNTTNNTIDNEVIYSEDCYPIPQEGISIPSHVEFIGVFCTIPKQYWEAANITIKNSTTKQLIDAFAFVPEKKILDRSNIVTAESNDTKLNVIILGLDSVSNMNLKRIFPKTQKFLIESLNAISMEGYAKLGDCTFPNLIALLAGINTTTAEKSCMSKNWFFDDCPLMWKKFAAEGYVTSFIEDAPQIGTFNYARNGFREPPVDYYFRPIGHVLESLCTDFRRSAICSGPRLAIEVLLNYMKRLALFMTQKKTDQRYFQLGWASGLTHDDLNLGMLGDQPTVEFLEWLQSEPQLLNKSLLIVMSDHGIRIGDFRKTRQGQIENNMPFINFVFPEWFKKKYSTAMENLKNNRHRLTTPYDVHELLLDILNMTNIEESRIKERMATLDLHRLKNEIPRGISLFLPTPPERTCAMAEIEEHFCVCHETEEFDIKSDIAHQAANFIVYHLNLLISKFPNCAYLELKEITDAYTYNTSETQGTNTLIDSSTRPALSVVKVTFVSAPGNAEFEGTVVPHFSNNTYSWAVSDISRVNTYGSQSHCVNDKNIKNYCYCTDLLNIK